MKLSVITINLNNRNGLLKTIGSVISQSSKDFEYIVIDGGSTDGSRELIEHYADRFAYWVSEPDHGIYSAMNKGIRKARGEYVLMLNSGDCLIDEKVLGRMLPYLLSGADIIQGNVLILQKGEWIKNTGYGRSELTFRDAYNGLFLHQASFIRRVLHETYGYYDESKMMISDTIFFLKALGFGEASFQYVDITISMLEEGGISSLPNPGWKRIREEEDIFYDALVPSRLLKMCRNEERKVDFYDTLHKYRPLWYFALILEKVARFFSRNC